MNGAADFLATTILGIILLGLILWGVWRLADLIIAAVDFMTRFEKRRDR